MIFLVVVCLSIRQMEVFCVVCQRKVLSFMKYVVICLVSRQVSVKTYSCRKVFEVNIFIERKLNCHNVNIVFQEFFLSSKENSSIVNITMEYTLWQIVALALFL